MEHENATDAFSQLDAWLQKFSRALLAQMQEMAKFWRCLARFFLRRARQRARLSVQVPRHRMKKLRSTCA